MAAALPPSNVCGANSCCPEGGSGQTAFGNAAQTYVAHCPDGSIGQSTATVPACTVFRLTQEEADAAALAQAQAQAEAALVCLECSASEVGPLNSAVYESGRNKIFAVRGGSVYQLNATTGLQESTSRYAGPTLSDSYIDYDAGRDCLWVSYSPTFKAPPGSGSPTNDKYIYKLNPDDFSILQTVGLSAQQIGSFTGYQADLVLRSLRVNGIYLGLTHTDPSISNGIKMFVFDPDTLPFATWNVSNTTARWAFIDVLAGDWIYSNDDDYNFGVTKSDAIGNVIDNSGNYPSSGSSANTKRIYGFCSSGLFIYAANRSNLILKLPWGGVDGIAIDTGLSDADVWNIRSNANDGKVYAADFGANSIVIIDPSDDSFVVKTGFDSPFDVVFTPTKAFAVQHGDVGIEEIV